MPALSATPSGGGALLGYARVSKGEGQNDALQTKASGSATRVGPSVDRYTAGVRGHPFRNR